MRRKLCVPSRCSSSAYRRQQSSRRNAGKPCNEARPEADSVSNRHSSLGIQWCRECHHGHELLSHALARHQIRHTYWSFNHFLLCHRLPEHLLAAQLGISNALRPKHGREKQKQGLELFRKSFPYVLPHTCHRADARREQCSPQAKRVQVSE